MAFWQTKTFLCHLCCVRVVEAGDCCLGITYLIFKHVNEVSSQIPEIQRGEESESFRARTYRTRREFRLTSR